MLFVFFLIGLSTLSSFSSAEFQLEDFEIAPYSVSRSEKAYEERRYDAMKWACHLATQKRFTSRMMEPQLFALFKYFSGENDQKVKMPLTMPLTMKYTKNSKGNEEGEMCYYLPQRFQSDPPKPIDSQISISARPAVTVYARTFKGLASGRDAWNNEALILKKDLETAKEKGVNYDTYISAGYEAPNKQNERKNEVWYLKN